MPSNSRLVTSLGPIAAAAFGGLAFFDIIGVFGLRLAIIGLAVLVLLAFAIVRSDRIRGGTQ